ncbi:hypothetical protein AMTRI_Chr03g48490 [Amborella trichopoda]
MNGARGCPKFKLNSFNTLAKSHIFRTLSPDSLVSSHISRLYISLSKLCKQNQSLCSVVFLILSLFLAPTISLTRTIILVKGCCTLSRHHSHRRLLHQVKISLKPTEIYQRTSTGPSLAL